MLPLLTALPVSLHIIAWVVMAMLLTCLLMIGIHRVLPFELRRQHNDVTGFLIAVIGIFYGLIMASILVIAVNRFDHAEKIVEKEANLIGDIARNAGTLSPHMATQVIPLASRYLEDVITQEWPMQRQGQKTFVGLQTLAEMNQAIGRYEPKTPRESAYYSAMLRKLSDLHDARRERIFLADQGIATEVWMVILAGGVLTIGFALFFGVSQRKIHFLFASALAIAIALIFALIEIFDQPFKGDISVSNEPYRVVWQLVKSN